MGHRVCSRVVCIINSFPIVHGVEMCAGKQGSFRWENGVTIDVCLFGTVVMFCTNVWRNNGNSSLHDQAGEGNSCWCCVPGVGLRSKDIMSMFGSMG